MIYGVESVFNFGFNFQIKLLGASHQQAKQVSKPVSYPSLSDKLWAIGNPANNDGPNRTKQELEIANIARLNHEWCRRQRTVARELRSCFGCQSSLSNYFASEKRP